MISRRNLPSILLFLIVAVCRGFTMQMVINPSDRRTLNNSPVPALSSSRGGPSVSRTRSEAVATGSIEMQQRKPSLRSRMGAVIGDLKSGLGRRATNVDIVEDVADFATLLKTSNEQVAVAVFFHAPFCKACQAAAPHFYSLSRKYHNVKFLSVPLTPMNKEGLQALGIKKFPFGHIYDSQRDLLDEQPILRKLIPRFEERLKAHISERTKSPQSLEEESAR